MDFIRLKRIGSERIDSERIDHTKEYQLAGRKQIAELVDIRLKHLKEDTGPITGEEQKKCGFIETVQTYVSIKRTI